MAILVRTNSQTVAFQEACRAAGVPTRAVAAAGLLDDPAVTSALATVGERPEAPVAAVVPQLRTLAAGASHASGPPSGVAALVRLADDFARRHPDASAAGLEAWLALTVGDASDVAPADAVAICTFHRAKGLEWPAVWVTGLEAGLVPMAYAVTPEAEAEERRLLYVALTRAERELRCSWARQRQLGGRQVPRQPSPWLPLVGTAADVTGEGRGAGDDATWAEPWRRQLGADRLRLAGIAEASSRQGRGPTRRERPGAGADPAVLGALRAWRGAAARAAAVPPHVILHDVTLAALASARPATVDELLTVPGLGPVKAARYGPALLDLVARPRATA